MKKAALILAALALGPSFAAPLYYTLTGKISFVPSDVGGYAAAHDIKPGNTVTYILEVDTARNGFTRFDGTTTVKPDSINTGTGYRADYFFDTLVTPSLFSAAVTDSASGSFFGYQTVTKLGANFRYSAAFQILIGNPDHGTQILVYIPDTSATLFLPKVGDVLSGTEAYVNGSAASSSASMSLTVAAVGNTRPSDGVRPRMALASSWMQADWQGGALMLRNRSGKNAEARIVDASGRTVLAQTLGDKARLPVSNLPHGALFLEVTSPGQYGFWGRL